MKLFSSISKAGAGVKTAYGVVAACAGLVVAGWISRGAVQDFKASQEKLYMKMDSIEQKVDYINTEQSFMAGDILDIRDSLGEIKGHQDEQDEYMARMEGAAKFYIRNQKAMTEESMQDALEVILKKKLDPTSCTKIPYRENFCADNTGPEKQTYNLTQ